MAVDGHAQLGRGARVGRYEIDRALGSSPLAAVYRAADLDSDAAVALKRSIEPTDTARWEIEARLLSEVDHPGIASLIDHFEEPPGTYNLVTRLIDGTDLGRVLWDRGAPGLPVRDVLRWMGDACSALQYLHDQQIVHGDVKPGNLILGCEQVVLVDFGLASRLVGDEHAARGGTPRFMAPEVFAGEAASPRSDVFGIAATAWALITGSPPAYGEDRTLEGIAEASPELERALRAGLAFSPEARIESAAAVAEVLGAPVTGDAGSSLSVSIEFNGIRRPLLEAIVGAAAGVFEAAAASIALVDATGPRLTYVAAWGAGASEVVGLQLPDRTGIAGAAVETGRAQVVPRCRTDPRFAAQVARGTGYVPHTMLVLPLLRQGAVAGVLSLLDRRGGGSYDSGDIPQAGLFAGIAAESLAT